jgi:tetrahydromethanopterin S-methyltransferase subunit F
MADTGLKNKELLKELTISGSLAIKSKNEFGVNLFAQEDLKDGVIYGSLVKPKYNEEELVKSVDVVITELLPIETPILPDTVLRSVYNVVTQSVIDLTIQIETLNVEVSELNSKVATLEAVTESLRIEVDSKDLLIEVANKQLEESNKKISDTTIDLSNAIQRGIAESIERVSLFARNESLQSTIQSLLEQIDTLNQQLFGRQSAIIEGAITTSEIGVIIKSTKEDALKNTLIYFARLNASSSDRRGWENGPTIEVENFTDQTLTVFVSYPSGLSDNNDDFVLNQGQANPREVGQLLQVPNPNGLVLGPKEKKDITFTFREDIDGKDVVKLNALYATKDTLFKGNISIRYFAGQINGAIAAQTTEIDSLTIPIHFRKQYGKNYTGPTS